MQVACPVLSKGWLTGSKCPPESGGTQQYAAGSHTSRYSMVQLLQGVRRIRTS